MAWFLYDRDQPHERVIQETFLVRSSRSEVYYKKDVLKNFEKLTGKHLCQSPFLKKLQTLAFKNIFFYRTPLVAASVLWQTIREQLPLVPLEGKTKHFYLITVVSLSQFFPSDR